MCYLKSILTYVSTLNPHNTFKKVGWHMHMLWNVSVCRVVDGGCCLIGKIVAASSSVLEFQSTRVIRTALARSLYPTLWPSSLCNL